MPVPQWITAALNLVPGPAKAEITEWLEGNTLAPSFTAGIQLPAGPTKDLVQAVLLVCRVLGGQTDADTAKRRELVKAWAAPDLTAEMNAYIKAHNDMKTAKPGAVILMPSFRHANSAEQQNAKDTVVTAVAMLTKAYLAAKFVVTSNGASAGAQLTTYNDWFGVYSKPRAEKVAGYLKKLHDSIATKPICLYYRGPKAKGPQDEPHTSALNTPDDSFAEAYTEETIQRLPQFDKKFNHITLCKAFFARHKKVTNSKKGTVKNVTITSTKMKGYDSVPGVLLHELTHHVCNTEDETRPDNGEATYGTADCTWLKNNHVDLAANNADNYEYFCESFNQ